MAKGSPNDETMKLNFIAKVWDKVAEDYRPIYIAPDATDAVRGDVYLTDDIDAETDAATGVTAVSPKGVNKVKEDLEGQISSLSSSTNENYETLKSQVDTNTKNISTNTENIATNKSDIAALQTKVQDYDTVKNQVETNKQAIQTANEEIAKTNQSITDKLPPVGTVYRSNEESPTPTDVWGGTWTREADRHDFQGFYIYTRTA